LPVVCNSQDTLSLFQRPFHFNAAYCGSAFIYTIAQGTTIDGSYASRWIQIPVVGVTFQSSTLASVVLLIYVARYLTRIADKAVTFKETILPLWMPVFCCIGTHPARKLFNYGNHFYDGNCTGVFGWISA
jgi:cell division protein FtsW (lipid II flippase)